MAKPVILTVDDDLEVLGAIERDLRSHYRSDYRILKAGSGREALEAARQLKERGTPIALFLVDQRMPEMSGTELLREVLKLYPDSRRVLLTAYADTQAAIAGINDVGLDHYLLKPWDPPDQRLYPVLDDLLSDWTAHVRLPYEGIRVAGARSSPRSFAVKEFLSSNQVPYQWIDVDEDPPTRELIRTFGDSTKLPVLLFPDGSHLVAPTNRELAEKIGMQTRARLPFYDLVIVGGGPAGLAAAVYGASEGLRTLLVEHNAPGGQAGTSSRIENYLGFPSGVSGADLARRALTQARRFGAEVLTSGGRGSAPRGSIPHRPARGRDGRLVLRGRPGHGRIRSDSGGSRNRAPPRHRRLLRRRDDRGRDLPREGRVRPRGRELGGAGRPLFLALRAPRHLARPRKIPRPVDVAVPGRPDRGHAEHRSPDAGRGHRGLRHGPARESGRPWRG